MLPPPKTPRDPLDDLADVLRQQNKDSDRVLDLPADLSLSFFMERDAFRYEAERQRYEADLESGDRARARQEKR
jgi:hypothetical protein